MAILIYRLVLDEKERAKEFTACSMNDFYLLLASLPSGKLRRQADVQGSKRLREKLVRKGGGSQPPGLDVALRFQVRMRNRDPTLKGMPYEEAEAHLLREWDKVPFDFDFGFGGSSAETPHAPPRSALSPLPSQPQPAAERSATPDEPACSPGDDDVLPTPACLDAAFDAALGDLSDMPAPGVCEHTPAPAPAGGSREARSATHERQAIELRAVLDEQRRRIGELEAAVAAAEKSALRAARQLEAHSSKAVAKQRAAEEATERLAARGRGRGGAEGAAGRLGGRAAPAGVGFSH
eukprot:scaffold7630_cov122-Isochrysis_galbana.AAC.2